ncbi:MAG: chloride channel protein [Phycisphaerales bacterium JB050]
MADDPPNLRLWKRMVGLLHKAGLRDDWYLIGLGAVIGVVTAFGAIGFKTALDSTSEGVFSIVGNLPIWLLPVAPIAGALITATLIFFFAPEAKGHGVPEVIDAVYRRGGKIRKRVALVKALASITTIGSGGSAGAEGPIVQIGAAIGSGVAFFLRIDRDQVPTLLGCGAAAGIASVFNAPIAGVFFCLEILLRDFSLKTFTPIVVASVISTATTQAWFGENKAIFAVTDELSDYQFTYTELPSYLLLGLLCGAVAVAFIKMLYKSEDLAEELKVHPIVKPMLGAAMLGVLGIGYLLLVRTQGLHAEVPNFFGNGYETIEALLEPGTYLASEAVAEGTTHAALVGGEAGVTSNPLMPGEIVSTSILMLGLLLFCKIVATCLTLGSGGSGGVFAPSLFLGAAAGALFGEVLSIIGLLPDGGSPAAYALVGMAAVVAGTTHAPLTAILILFELTRDVYVLLPIMLAAVLSTVVAQLIMHDSIYSLKLTRRGLSFGTRADMTMLRRLTARDVQPIPHVEVRPADPVSRLFELRDIYRIVDFVVIDSDNQYVGLVTAQDLRMVLIEREAIPYLLVAELVRTDLPVIEPDEPLDSILRKFSETEVSSLAMVGPPVGKPNAKPIVYGLITRGRLMRRYQQALAER